jgi:hypothetical protein
MVASDEPLQFVNRTLDEIIETGCTLIPIVFMRPEAQIFVGTLGVDSIITAVITSESVLCDSILKAPSKPYLKALVYFETNDKSTGLRAMHNVVKIWESYSTKHQMMRLLFQSDTGKIFGKEASLESFNNKKLLWSLPAQRA